MIDTSQIHKMMSDVCDFREMMGLPLCRGHITMSDRELHDSLAIEELTELCDADSDIERLDAIIDTCYVLCGRIAHIFGREYRGQIDMKYGTQAIIISYMHSVAMAKGYDFTGAWDEIHSSNMSKTCENPYHVHATYEHYASKGIKCDHRRAVNSRIVVFVRSDVTLDDGTEIKAGKVLKSVAYKPANLTRFIGCSA